MCVEIDGKQSQSVEQIEYQRVLIKRNRKMDEEIRNRISKANENQ